MRPVTLTLTLTLTLTRTLTLTLTLTLTRSQVRYEFAWSVQLGGAPGTSVPLYLPSVSRRALIPAGTLPPARYAPPFRTPPLPLHLPSAPPYPPSVPRELTSIPRYLLSVPRYLPCLLRAGTLPAGQPSAVTLRARAVLADGSRLNARLGLGKGLGLGLGLGLGSA